MLACPLSANRVLTRRSKKHRYSMPGAAVTAASDHLVGTSERGRYFTAERILAFSRYKLPTCKIPRSPIHVFASSASAFADAAALPRALYTCERP